MTPNRKPERVDAVIIGAGASGAAAAKVLTERGMRVVALEKGPWRTKESFGGDELANVNRYNLWPDPILNPRTSRSSAADEAEVDLFCPVPQMVGGGTVHWQGWLPRFTPNDFRLRSIAGELPGTTLADWPIGYDDLEPYYDRVEWAFGVSGQAGANSTRVRARAAIRVRRCRSPATPRNSTRVARSWGGTRSRPPRPRCRSRSTVARPPW